VDPDGLRIRGPASLIILKNLLNSTPTGQKLLRETDTPCANLDIFVEDQEAVTVRNEEIKQLGDNPDWANFTFANLAPREGLEFGTTSPQRVGAADFIKIEMHLGSLYVWRKATVAQRDFYGGTGDQGAQNRRIWSLLRRVPTSTPYEMSYRARAVVLGHELQHAIQLLQGDRSMPEPPAYKTGAALGAELAW
jgi:hypothetical protein